MYYYYTFVHIRHGRVSKTPIYQDILSILNASPQTIVDRSMLERNIEALKGFVMSMTCRLFIGECLKQNNRTEMGDSRGSSQLSIQVG